MKIESILRRKGGTEVTLGETGYHFKPGPGGAHVAEVEDKAHIQTFLAIPEGYRIAEDSDTAPSATAKSIIEGSTAAPAGGTDFDALDKEALASIFEAQIGMKPPSTLSKAKIIEALRASPVA